MFRYDGWLTRVLVNSHKSIKKTPLMLWVRISSRAMCTTLCNTVCQWLATRLVVFSGYSDVIHHTTAGYNWNIVESGVSHLYQPVYRNKDNNLDLDNFRAITLISCLEKLFTSILHERLTFLNNEIALISFNHNAFRKGNSTTDHLFLLQSIGKTNCCGFIAFRNAFDTVWRTVLWKIMINSGIKGKIFTVVYKMYDNIKYVYNIRRFVLIYI
jgi:hypothetical protein